MLSKVSFLFFLWFSIYNCMLCDIIKNNSSIKFIVRREFG